MCRRSLCGNREISCLTGRPAAAGPHREGEEPKPVMHGHEKSHSAIVAKKPPNKAGKPAAEAVERRAGTEGNAGQQSTRRTQIRAGVSQALDRVRKAARQRKRRSSPRSSTTSASRRSIWRSTPFRVRRPRSGRHEMAGIQGRARAQARGPAAGSTGEHIGRNRRAGRIYRRRTAGRGRWQSQHWRTKSSRAQPLWSSRPSTRRTSSGSLTGSVPDGDLTMR